MIFEEFLKKGWLLEFCMTQLYGFGVSNKVTKEFTEIITPTNILNETNF